jgi:ribosomal RNA assembly protein
MGRLQSFINISLTLSLGSSTFLLIYRTFKKEQRSLYPMDEENYSQEVKMPKERIAVLIGAKGETKQELEKELSVKLDINSQEGDVIISGPDSLNLLIAKDVVKAIARGFNPEIAKTLVKEETFLEIISLTDYSPHRNHQLRLKGRVIGRGGRTRGLIEEYTGCRISIYGKTVGIIGEGEMLRIARKAVDALLTGSPHAFVYKWLEKQRTMQGPEF